VNFRLKLIGLLRCLRYFVASCLSWHFVVKVGE
jgi:hypothetical protein